MNREFASPIKSAINLVVLSFTCITIALAAMAVSTIYSGNACSSNHQAFEKSIGQGPYHFKKIPHPHLDDPVVGAEADFSIRRESDGYYATIRIIAGPFKNEDHAYAFTSAIDDSISRVQQINVKPGG